jgi:hypothetical protein
MIGAGQQWAAGNERRPIEEKQEYSSVLLHHHTVAFIGYGECLYFTT